MSTNATTICLLDDDTSVLKATSRMLSYAGYHVQSFTDAVAFLSYAKGHHPRAVVLDILMPAMNGLEVQRRLRDLSPTTRVIILSSRDDAIVRATAMRQGASSFFVKPVDSKELLAALASALGQDAEKTDGSSEMSPPLQECSQQERTAECAQNLEHSIPN